VSAPASETELTIRKLSLWARSERWGGQRGESDRQFLWPGLRRVLLDRIEGQRSLVMGGFVSGVRRPVCRVLFTSGVSDPESWSYGYFYTDECYRGRAIGTRVLAKGLELLEQRGARRCACYVNPDNVASMVVNRRLGFRNSGFAKAVWASGVASSLESDSSSEVRETSPESASSVVREHTGRLGTFLILEELYCRRSLKPWRAPQCRHFLFRQGGNPIGAATARQAELVMAFWRDLSGGSGELARFIGGLSIEPIKRVSVLVPDAVVTDLPSPDYTFRVLANELRLAR